MTKYQLSDCTLESYMEIVNAQPPKDRLHYDKIALESATGNAVLLQKLYTDIISKSNIDFGKIPDSKGDITKFVSYGIMNEAISSLNIMFQGQQNEDIDRMNAMHDSIVSMRNDFEFGYKFNIDFIELTYCIGVSTLSELINIGILAYTKKLKDAAATVDFPISSSVKKKDMIIVKGANSYISMYRKGEWGTLMRQFKKDPKNALGSVGVANEAFGVQGPSDKFAGPAQLFSSIAEKTAELPTAVKVGAVVIIAVTTIFFAVRNLLYFFFKKASNVDSNIKTQKEFLEYAMDTDSSASQESIDKMERKKSKMEKLSNFIQAKILRTESDAKKELTKSNTENYEAQEIRAAASNTDIEF